MTAKKKKPMIVLAVIVALLITVFISIFRRNCI